MPGAPRDPREKVSREMALLVEGKDEVNFFGALLEHIGLTDVYMADVGGNTQFSVRVPAVLQIPGFRDSVKSYAIIRASSGAARCGVNPDGGDT